jgi:hypothetical protein
VLTWLTDLAPTTLSGYQQDSIRKIYERLLEEEKECREGKCPDKN